MVEQHPLSGGIAGGKEQFDDSLRTRRPFDQD
jgi:hypothetical protein